MCKYNFNIDNKSKYTHFYYYITFYYLFIIKNEYIYYITQVNSFTKKTKLILLSLTNKLLRGLNFIYVNDKRLSL